MKSTFGGLHIIKGIKAVYEATRALEYGTNGVSMSAIDVVEIFTN